MNNWLRRELQKEMLEILFENYPNQILLKDLRYKVSPGESFFNQNLEYLVEHNLLKHEYRNHKDGCFETYEHFYKITAKGIDFLAADGGLSAILGVVTVKLHSDTIQALLVSKINQSDIPIEEKNHLKTILGKVGDAALSKLTEKAIEALPAASAIALIQSLAS